MCQCNCLRDNVVVVIMSGKGIPHAKSAQRGAELVHTVDEAKKAEKAKKAAAVHKTADKEKKAAAVHKTAVEAKKAAAVHKTADEAKKAAAVHKTADEAKKAADVHKAADEAKKAADVHKAADKAKEAAAVHKAIDKEKNAPDAQKAVHKTKKVTSTEQTSDGAKKAADVRKPHGNDTNASRVLYADAGQHVQDKSTEDLTGSHMKTPEEINKKRVKKTDNTRKKIDRQDAEPADKTPGETKHIHEGLQASADTVQNKLNTEILSLGISIRDNITTVLASQGSSPVTEEEHNGELVAIGTNECVEDENIPPEASVGLDVENEEVHMEDGSEVQDKDIPLDTNAVDSEINVKINPTAFDFFMCPTIPLYGSHVMSPQVGLMQDMQEIEVGGGVALLLAGSLLTTMEVNGCVSRLQESMIRLLKKYIHIYKSPPVAVVGTDDEFHNPIHAAEKEESAAYLRKVMQPQQEDKIMHTIYTMMHMKGKTAARNADWDCHDTPEGKLQEVDAKMACKTKQMHEARTKQLWNHVQTPVTSENLRKMLCGPQEVESQGPVVDFFTRLFWTDAADAYMCNTMLASTMDPDPHALPDRFPILAKIEHLESCLREIGDSAHELKNRQEKEDEILKWQILSIMGDVVSDYKQAMVRAEVADLLRAKNELQKVQPPYEMDERFRRVLRTSAKNLEHENYAQVSVSLRPMLAFLNTIMILKDQRLMPVFQHFADEYARTGGGVYKKFVDCLHAEANGAPPGILEKLRLVVQLVSATNWPFSVTSNLLGLKSANMDLFLEYYAVYEDEFLPSTDKRDTHQWVNNWDGHANHGKNNPSHSTVSTEVLLGGMGKMLEVYSEHGNFKPADFDSVTDWFKDTKKGVTIMRIMQVVCPNSSNRSDTKCVWPEWDTGTLEEANDTNEQETTDQHRILIVAHHGSLHCLVVQGVGGHKRHDSRHHRGAVKRDKIGRKVEEPEDIQRQDVLLLRDVLQRLVGELGVLRQAW